MANPGLSRFNGSPTSSPNVNHSGGETEIKFGILWTIKKFSRVQEQSIDSSNFSASPNDGIKWCLRLYPKGNYTGQEMFSVRWPYGEYVSLFLKKTTIRPTVDPDISARYEFSIINNSGEKKVTRIDQGLPKYYGSEWGGFPGYIRRKTLMNENNGLIQNDQLTICCEVTIDKVSVEEPENTNSICFKDLHLGSSRLIDDLGHLLNSEYFSDIILVAEDKDLRAHKAILAARSQVFAAMFRHDLEENRVAIPNICYSTLEAVIRFIYTNKLAITDHQMAKELLYAADKYGLEDLKAMCDQVLSAKLTAENVVQLLPLASLYNCTNLKAQLILFMKTHTTDDAVSQLFSLLISQHPQQVARALES